jgi:predicted nucleotidyltransferase
MASRHVIQRFADRLATNYGPERVILFGSHARKRADVGSDVDILVLMSFRGSSVRQAAAILSDLRPEFPVDLLVRTRAEFDRRIKQGDCFLSDIDQQGLVLYEKAHAGVGAES